MLFFRSLLEILALLALLALLLLTYLPVKSQTRIFAPLDLLYKYKLEEEEDTSQWMDGRTEGVFFSFSSTRPSPLPLSGTDPGKAATFVLP